MRLFSTLFETVRCFDPNFPVNLIIGVLLCFLLKYLKAHPIDDDVFLCLDDDNEDDPI